MKSLVSYVQQLFVSDCVKSIRFTERARLELRGLINSTVFFNEVCMEINYSILLCHLSLFFLADEILSLFLSDKA